MSIHRLLMRLFSAFFGRKTLNGNVKHFVFDLTCDVTCDPGVKFSNFIWKISAMPLHCSVNFFATPVGFRDKWGGGATPPLPAEGRGRTRPSGARVKVLINFGFVTSFEDSHHILLFWYIYGAQLIQWFCYSKHIHVNCCSYQWSKWSIATSLSPKCYSANVPLDFCASADFDIKYFFNEDTAGVLGNT